MRPCFMECIKAGLGSKVGISGAWTPYRQHPEQSHHRGRGGVMAGCHVGNHTAAHLQLLYNYSCTVRRLFHSACSAAGERLVEPDA